MEDQKILEIVDFLKPLTNFMGLKYFSHNTECIQYVWYYIFQNAAVSSTGFSKEEFEFATKITYQIPDEFKTKEFQEVIEIHIEEFEEIARLLEKKDIFSSFPYETSCYSTDYYEQIIETVYWEKDLHKHKDIKINSSSEMKITINESISFRFLIHLVNLMDNITDSKNIHLHNLLIESKKILISSNYDEGDFEIKSLKDLIVFVDSAFLVIEPHHFSNTKFENTIEKIIDSVAFQFGYFFNVDIRNLKYFPTIDESSYDDMRKKILNLPAQDLIISQEYNPLLIQFYRMGVLSNLPNVQFLGFYQILEYHFSYVVNKELYRNLEYELKDPRFINSNSESLERLRIIFEKNSISRLNETVKLERVLEFFIQKDEISGFIDQIEKITGEKIFTKECDYFGKRIRISKEKNDLIPNIASMIKQTRNAIVHATDSFDFQPRYRPFSLEDQVIVEKQIPLLRFLAEKVIIATSNQFKFE